MKLKVVTGVSLLVVVAAAAANAGAYTNIVAFGDSLSDVGNVYNQTFGLAPASPYYQGRYSNGPLWVEDLATDQGLPVPTKSRSSGLDYAYAGTHTGSGYTTEVIFQFPNTGTQISSYLGNHTPTANDLYTVWAGANDFFDGQTNASVPVNNLVAHVTALANAGAKTLIVPNLPLLGETPSYRGTASEAAMNALSQSFNTQLATAMTSLASSLNIQIYQPDIATVFSNIIASPATYGFTNVTAPAYNGSTVVSNPDQYLFWDDVHPTRVGHALLGQYVSDLVDTHTWSASAAASATWGTAGNWQPAASPAARWIVKLDNSASVAKTANVLAPSTVRSVSIGAAGGNTMTLRIAAAGTLAATQDVSVFALGNLALDNAAIVTPSLKLVGGNLSGTGTISGNLSADAASHVLVQLRGGAAGAYDSLRVTGSASLNGRLTVSLGDGFVALPGMSFDVLEYGSHSGALAVDNQSGFAGLRFTPTYTDASLSILADATGGDANLDGAVNIVDLGALASHWQQSGDWLAGDFSHDGLVNIIDLGLLAGNWQAGAASLTADLAALGLPDVSLPEPASVVTVAAVAAFLPLTKRSRRSR